MSTITTTSATQLPAWYNQYAQNLIGRGLSVTSEPFQTYGAARVAPFTADQQRAFDIGRQGIGSWQPFVNEGAQMVRDAASGSAAAAAAPMIQQGIGTFPQNAAAYMNPFVDEVVSNVGTIAARNLRENLLPEVNRTFIGSGTFGGSRSADFTARAVRDTNEAALRQQAELMRQGFTDAAGIFNQDQSRALTGANLTGNLNVSDLYRRMQAGQTQAGIGGTVQSNIAGDVASLSGIGQQQQNLAQTSANLAFEDFQAQRDFPWLQTQRLAAIGQGIRLPETRQVTEPGPNQTAQNIGAIVSGIGALGSVLRR